MTHHITKLIRAVHFLVLAFLMTLSTQVNAAETVMVCDAPKGGKQYFKHIDPFFGEPIVEKKLEGSWKSWESVYPNAYIPSEVSVYDSGAKMQSYSEDYEFDVPEIGIKKGDPVRFHMTTVLDFEFGSFDFKRRAYYSLVKSQGDFLIRIPKFELEFVSGCEIIK